MKWIIVISLFCLSFSFIYSFINKSNLDLSNNSESFYEYSSVTIDGKEFKMSNLKGKKVIIVNVASKCGYTPQYEGLQTLWTNHKKDLVVIGVPTNNFKQEPGSNNEIKDFCETNFGINFPMTEKIEVIGEKSHPVYKWLSSSNLNGWNDKSPKWNFYKYLVYQNGNLSKVLASSINPRDPIITDFIESD